MPPVFNISLEAILRGCDKSLDWFKGNSMENPWEFSPMKRCPLKQQTIEPVFFASDPDPSPPGRPGHWKVGKVMINCSTMAFGKSTILSQSLTKNGWILWVFLCSVIKSAETLMSSRSKLRKRSHWFCFQQTTMGMESCQLDEIITLPGFLCHSPYQTTLTFNWGQFAPRNREWLEMGARFST